MESRIEIYAVVPSPTVLRIQENLLEAMSKTPDVTPAEILAALILQFLAICKSSLGGQISPEALEAYESALYQTLFGEVIKQIATHAKCVVAQLPDFPQTQS